MSENYTPFQAKVDYELIIIPLLMCIPTFFFTFAAGDMTTLWVLLFLFILLGIFITKLFTSYEYGIDKSARSLIIKSMFGRKSIPIDNIKRIVKTNTWLASPALSLDRLSIGTSSNRTIVISPLDKKGFIATIVSLNESVKV